LPLEENGNLDNWHLSANTAKWEPMACTSTMVICQREQSVVRQRYLNWAMMWIRRIAIGAIFLTTLATLRSCSGPHPGPTHFATEEENNLLARMLYSEQAGQGPMIMRAAAWVAINRVLDTKNFPKANSLADALIPGQFFVRSQEDIDNRIEADPLETAAWEQAQHMAREVIHDHKAYGIANDLSDGALFFANVTRDDEARETYEKLLREVGVERYGILAGNISWFFYNATASVPVPDEIRPKY
jgi:hypothetical protein